MRKRKKTPFAEKLVGWGGEKSAQQIIDESRGKMILGYREPKEFVQEKGQFLKQPLVRKAIKRGKGKTPRANVQKGIKGLWDVI